MIKTGLEFMGMPVMVDEFMPDHMIRLAPLSGAADVMETVYKLYEEAANQTGISDVTGDLYRKSLHGQYAVRFVVEDGEMRALGPFPLWTDKHRDDL